MGRPAAQVIDDGLKIYATGVFVSVGMGYDLTTSIIVSGVVMLLYTFMGGLWAVIVTDYVQFIVLTLGVIVLFPLVFGRLGEVRCAGAGRAAGLSLADQRAVLAALRARVLPARAAQLQRQLGVRAEVLQRSGRARGPKGRRCSRWG